VYAILEEKCGSKNRVYICENSAKAKFVAKLFLGEDEEGEYEKEVAPYSKLIDCQYVI